MATDFQAILHKNESSLHMKLVGDFDRTSAQEVLEIIKKRSNQVSRVFIHTNCLNQIHPEAQKVFQEDANFMQVQPIPVLFTGEKASQLNPNQNN